MAPARLPFADGVLGTARRLVGRDLRARAEQEAAEAAGRLEPRGPDPVVEADVAALSEPARRYLRLAGVVGRPRVRSFRVRQHGRFRTGPTARWTPFEAWQVNVVAPIARIYHMRLDVFGLVPMVGRDVYRSGRGAMHGTLLGLVPVVDGRGPEYDAGELVTWLADALLLAPSMLLGPHVRWTTIDDRRFGVSVTDRGLRVSAIAAVDGRGRVVELRTHDRWMTRPGGLERAPWSTPISGWTPAGDRPFPGPAQAIWHLDDGPFVYADATFDPASFATDVLPVDEPVGDRPGPP